MNDGRRGPAFGGRVSVTDWDDFRWTGIASDFWGRS